MSVEERMEGLPAAVGQRVRGARSRQGWTLDDLARYSGVSRRMIVNVEAGASNPSIATLLRLGAALRVSLAELVGETAPGVAATRTTAADRTPLWRGRFGGSAELVASADVPDMLELWDWVLEPGDHYSSDEHRPGTRELVHVISGQLQLTVDGVDHLLRSGDALSFRADVPHRYSCAGRRTTRFAMTVLEPVGRVRP